MIVIGIDGSMRATGLAAVERIGGTWRIRHVSCVLAANTEATGRLVAEQDGSRVDAISRAVEALLLSTSGAARAVAVEAPAGSQSASGAKSLALAYGTIRTTLRLLGVTPTIITAHEAKSVATGLAGASKDDVEAAMLALYVWPAAKRKAVESEAIADALALATVLTKRIDAQRAAA